MHATAAQDKDDLKEIMPVGGHAFVVQHAVHDLDVWWSIEKSPPERDTIN
jgi:hypothetical protein